MKVDELLTTARESMTVRRVYGDAVSQDGLTVIPAASIAGGAGGGAGADSQGEQGEGGGFGVAARPVGAYVIQNGFASWRPAVDVNRVISVVGVVVVTYLVMRPRMVRARAR
jgi:uncharacterized spore protein YtfJ